MLVALSLRWTFNELSWLFPSKVEDYRSRHSRIQAVVGRAQRVRTARTCDLQPSRRSCAPSQLFRRQSACSPCSQSDALPMGRPRRRLEDLRRHHDVGELLDSCPSIHEFPPLRTTFDAETSLLSVAERCGVLGGIGGRTLGAHFSPHRPRSRQRLPRTARRPLAAVLAAPHKGMNVPTTLQQTITIGRRPTRNTEPVAGPGGAYLPRYDITQKVANAARTQTADRCYTSATTQTST